MNYENILVDPDTYELKGLFVLPLCLGGVGWQFSSHKKKNKKKTAINLPHQKIAKITIRIMTLDSKIFRSSEFAHSG
jgi:hypothetical protein